MRVLIIGGGGQVGRELRALSWPDGLAVAAPDRAALDLTDPGDLDRALEDDETGLVVNAAAYTAVDAAETHEAAARAANEVGPRMLAEATAARRIPLVHISTDYVFSGEADRPYDESDATGPVSVYGATKLAGEEAVRAANPRSIVVRTAWVVSPHGSNFVKTMLRLAGERAELRVVDDQRGNPTSAADLAAAIVRMAGHVLGEAAPAFGTYHFVNAGEATWFALAERVLATSAALGGPAARVVPIPTSAYPTPARRPRSSRLSTARYERVFGAAPRRWEPAVDEIVARLVGRPAAPGRPVGGSA